MSLDYRHLRNHVIIASTALAMMAGSVAIAADRQPRPEPRGYHYSGPPRSTGERPRDVDRDHYHHDYRAEHRHHIGPFWGGPNWIEREIALDAILPEFFRSRDRYLSDYGLFGLEVPPVGYEWVRYGHDALLVNIAKGTVLQAVRGVF